MISRVRRARAIELWAGLALVATYAALRSIAAPDAVVLAWTAAAVVAGVLSPLAGLTIVAALGPFTEALTARGQITAAPLLVVAVLLGTVVRIALVRALPRLTLPVALALLLVVGTGLGVANSWMSFGAEQGRAAAEMWLPGIGGALAILFIAAWQAWRGQSWPAYVAGAAAIVAALVSALDFVGRGIVRESALGWLIRGSGLERVTGVIPAPNAAATIFLVGLGVCLAGVVLCRERTARTLAAIGATIAAGAVWLTYSRSGLIAAGVVIVIVAWARWRWRGAVLTGAALGTFAVLAVAAGLARDVPLVADQARLDAWAAAVRIWQAHPILGAGFRSFEWLHGQFGSPVLDAPHNEWLRLFAEEGIAVGLAGLAFALTTPLALLRSAERVVPLAAAGVAAGVFVMAAFNNPFIYIQVNVPAFIVIGAGLGATMRREDGNRAPAP